MFEFSRLRREDLKMVMRWRSSAHVTRYMNTDITMDIEAQNAWFDRQHVNLNWILFHDGRPIGFFNLSDYSFSHSRSGFGFYIGEKDLTFLGGLALPFFYNAIFSHFPITKLVADVFADNKPVRRLHELHGFDYVGTYKDHIYKYDRFHDIMTFELLKTKWDDQHFGEYICPLT